jgi:hypothetical protein
MWACKVHLLYELRYVILCVGNITEGEFPISLFEFPTSV